MSISKQLLALALGACASRSRLGAGKPHRGLSARAHERPGHSRGRGHLSRDRRGQAAGAQPRCCRRSTSALRARTRFTDHRGSARCRSDHGPGRSARAQLSSMDSSGYEREPDADRFSIGASTRRCSRPTSASCAPRPTTEPRSRTLILRVATAYFNVLAAEDNLASAVAQRDSVVPAARAGATALRGRLDRDHGRAAIAGRLRRCRRRSRSRRRDCCRRRTSSCARSSARSCRDLAAPMDDLPLLTPDPANADEWVQVALDSNLALAVEPLGRRRRERRDRDPERQSSADAEPVGQLHRRRVRTGCQTRLRPAFRTAESTPSTQLPEGDSWTLNLTLPDLHGRAQSLAHPAVRLSAPCGHRGARAHRAPNRAPDARRLSRRDLRDLARARLAPGRRVEPHGVARHGSRLRGRHADDRRRAGFAEQPAPRRDDVLAQPLRLHDQRAAPEAGGRQLSEADVEQVDGWLQQ